MWLYLIRHGESEANVANADLPDGALTPGGIAQAEALARYLEGESVDLVISSPLRRALQTADVLSRHWQAPHEVWQDLLEHRKNEPHRFLGRRGVADLFPAAACEESLPDEGFDFGMESNDAGHLRALRILERLRERFADQETKAAMVAHAGFNAFFLMALLGGSRQPGRMVVQGNCCVNRIRITPEELRLITVNELPPQ